MKSFTLLKWILIYFFLARQVRLFVTLGTGSFLAGALVADFAILALIFFYVTYALAIPPKNEPAFDSVKLVLLTVLALSFCQGIYFMNALPMADQSLVVRSFNSFRKMFLPLTLLFLFSYLLRIEFKKNGELVFKKLLNLFTIFLYVSIAYNWAEFILRTASPEINSIFIENYVAVLDNTPASGKMEIVNFTSQPWAGFIDLDINRVYGIALDMYVSGAIIFSAYLFFILFSERFKVISVFNCVVFGSLVLSGTRSFIVPFLLVNIVMLLKQYRRRGGIIVVAGSVAITVLAMSLGPVFKAENAYAPVVVAVGGGMIGEGGVLAFGEGPVHISIYSSELLVDGLETREWIGGITDIGWLMTIVEVGLVGTGIFLFLHLLVLKKRRRKGRMEDRYIKGLRIIILLDLIVYLAHVPVLWNRTIMVFHVLFLSLLYAWSHLRRIDDEHSSVRSWAVAQEA